MFEKYLIFTGRPNSGKSTTIRALTGLKVAVGKTPGTTTRINKYPIAKGLTLVDLPGYGKKVKASKKWEDNIKDRILEFINENAENILLAVHVINILTFIEANERMSKKGLINIDIEMVYYLKKTIGNYPLIVANKIDKGNEKQVLINIEAFVEAISKKNVEFASYVFPISAKKGIGVGHLKDTLVKKLVFEGFKKPFELLR
jgi:GTP-binding protein EngB required for normal cell division